MQYQSFLIKYAEIAIKGKNRHIFEDALVKQIKIALRRVDGEFAVSRVYGRMFVDALSDYDYEETVDALQHVFGIVGICPVEVTDIAAPEVLKEKAVSFFGREYPDTEKSFKMHVRRLDKRYPLDSPAINEEVGYRILQANPELKVDVHHPEHLMNIEIRDMAYLYVKVIPAVGGMPVGTNGNATLLLSGGIDSPVAGWMIAKRGVQINAVHFHS